MPFLISHETLLAYERPLCATSGHSITTHYAKAICRRQIEKSPLAQIEMSLSTGLVGEFWADDGDCDEPDGDRPDECVAGSAIAYGQIAFRSSASLAPPLASCLRLIASMDRR